jgi:phosphoribosylaminoimidazole-succinocarboxamide synthase
MFRKLKSLRKVEDKEIQINQRTRSRFNMRNQSTESKMNELGKVVYEGSVKSIIDPQKNDETFLFHYSDRYSIFDWGEMPDLISQKGVALASMADLFFQYIEDKNNWKNLEGLKGLSSEKLNKFLNSEFFQEIQERGISHHSLGKVRGENLERVLKVKSVPVLVPEEKVVGGSLGYDYSAYADKPQTSLVPLEVIFRFGAPKGSSLLKRLKDNEAYLKQLGLERIPEEGELFDWPVVEYSTKLENTDRILSLEEAREISGMSEAELEKLRVTTLALALQLKNLFSRMSVELWDGKFEYAFLPGEPRSFQLVDSIGPDELRLTYEKVQLSKEVFRQHYLNDSWELSVRKAKACAKERGVSDWKKICEEELGESPRPLPRDFRIFGEKLYQVLANEIALAMGKERVFDIGERLNELISLQ